VYPTCRAERRRGSMSWSRRSEIDLASREVILAFGQQKHPILLIQRFHPGVDYAAWMDDQLRQRVQARSYSRSVTVSSASPWQ